MTRTCEECGKPFQPKRSDARFCSELCAGRSWQKRNADKIRETHRAWYRRNVERIRGSNNAKSLRVSHGRYAAEDRTAMWQSQNGLCYLCGEPLVPGKEAVDHDHSCCPPNKSCRICRRGLAHSNCNVAIGTAGDDPARLRRMADALEAAQLAFRQRKAAAGVGEQLFLME